MGAYLSEPVTEKLSTNEKDENLCYGASSMQGWRISQEDAHNCILNYDKDSSLFAVYDGHGGHEVAAYCAQFLPDTIKSMEAYKKGNISQALEDAFLEFDATLVNEDVVSVLKSMAQNKDSQSESEAEEDNEINNLYEDAAMPLDELMAKYNGQTPPENPLIKKLCGSCTEKPISPYLRAKKARLETQAAGPSGAKINFQEKEFLLTDNSNESAPSDCDSSKVLPEDGNCIVSSTSHKESELCVQMIETDSRKAENSEETKAEGLGVIEPAGNGDCQVESVNSETEEWKSEVDVEVDTAEKQDKVNVTEEETPSVTHSGVGDTVDPVKVLSGEDTSKPKENHCSGLTESENTSEPQANGDIVDSEELSSVKGKGKGKGKGRGKGKSSFLIDVCEKEPVNDCKEKTGLKTQENKWNLRMKSAQQLYRNMLDGGDEDSDSDEDDENFDIEESDENGECGEESEDADEEEEVEEEEEEEVEENDECEDLPEEDDEDYRMDVKEEPGSDSGCTAVLALVKGNELYVANAGDSRCVVCRGGEALEMSQDHKPEDDIELHRIEAAGGKVTADGRVNGGLNLSRAIGDHAYKQNTNLPPKEQMITALPDVQTLTINPEQDEFMVLACDGIWNFMSSQEVIAFIKKRMIPEADNLSNICEELFDYCLAPNTLGDGTGCDNMTAIIVKFGGAKVGIHSKTLKRPAVEETSNSDVMLEKKRLKLAEEEEEHFTVGDSDSDGTEDKKQSLGDLTVEVDSAA